MVMMIRMTGKFWRRGSMMIDHRTGSGNGPYFTAGNDYEWDEYLRIGKIVV